MSSEPIDNLVPLADGEIVAVSHYVEPLRRAGLIELSAVMGTTQGRCLRRLRDRENWRLELDLPHVGPRAAYLKKHHERGWRVWLSQRGWLRAASPGEIEADNVRRLQADGIATMQLVAYGVQKRANHTRESFVMVEELNGYQQLDHFLRRRFPPLAEQTLSDRRLLRRLLECVADMARRFHDCGYNHRDFYCCHFFIHEVAPGEFMVRLIDLQRVEQRRWLRGRWKIKDLAQLAYSLPRDRISCTDQLRLARRYLNVERLRSTEKRWLRAVLAKRDGMIRRLGAHP